jgi:hypothetical protein
MLRILGKAEEKFSIDFQLIDAFHCVVDFRIQILQNSTIGKSGG